MNPLTETHVQAMQLPLRGGRDYFHGTDIFQTLMDLVGAATKISLQIHQLSTYPLSVRIINPKDVAALRDSHHLQSTLQAIALSGEKITLAVTQEPYRIFDGDRLPYDEGKIVEQSVVLEKSLVDSAAQTGTFIQRLVALNKHLLQKSTAYTDWVFFRLDLDNYPISPKRLELTIEREMGEGIYISSVSCDGVRQGRIFFARRKK